MSSKKKTKSTVQKPGGWTNYGAVPPATEDSIVEESINASAEHQEEKGSNWTAFVHIVCIIAGSGTLGIAYAIKQGGWVSIVSLIVAAIGAVYSNNKLIETLYYDSKTRKNSITQIAQDAFGNLGFITVGFFSSCITLGCPVLYLILSGDNLQILFQNLDVDLGMRNWVYICGGVMAIPFVLLKTMKEAAWLSVFGALTTFVVVIVVSFMSVADYSDHPNSGHDIINFRNIPLAMGTFSFSYGGNVVFPNVEAGMKNPSAWPRINFLAILFITLMYLLIGIPSYLTYGYATTSPIYLNLPSGWTVTASIFLITAHVLLALPIYLTSLALELEEYAGVNVSNLGKSREFIARILLRTSLMILTVWLAISVPYFADVMALMGAFGNGLLIIVVPILFWIKLYGWNRLNGPLEKTWVVFIMILATIGAVIGTWDASNSLWRRIIKG
ncbi:hypothetical protein G9A89_001847 [Geosiphon pyriformis]|nr:hypothetical protein G9A89_001847 [Geosiphon pyriformis]